MLPAWRIADPEFSQTPDDTLSGEGARLYGGRWNSVGNRVVYLSNNLGTATVEILVHLENKSVLDKYHKLKVEFPEECVISINESQLPPEWRNQTMTPITQAIGDDWIDNKESLILRIPSTAVPGEYNYLLNPNHMDYSKLVIGEIETYIMDQRLR